VGSENLDTINDRIDMMIKLLAAIYTKGSSNQEAITKLYSLQISPKQIAAILGVSNHNVSQVLYANRTNLDKKKRKGSMAKAEGATA
jgi:DNA-directed RNA polymerase specialized sigma24 family protein